MDNAGKVVGISRSGRVRKKSFKFADFESSDNVDKNNTVKMEEQDSDDSENSMDIDSKNQPLQDELNEFAEQHGRFMEDKEDDDEEDEEDNLQIDEDSNDDNGHDERTYSQANSLYMSEKTSKKSFVVKDGQMVPKKKGHRKDKGVTRFTDYMLWAREVRQEIVDANPEMDFSAVNKRLGEMWALVPNHQKFHWRKRAKKLASRASSKSNLPSPGKNSTKQNTPSKAKFVNKGSKSPAKYSKDAVSHKIASTPKISRLSNISNEMSPPTPYKVNGCTPIDVAAHLKLLGESLNNIGQKLKEHEGQIAVSGSLSVLLDSMLCVLGPLTCLTNQVEELGGAIPDQTLNTILDNIAYIMPGIV